ncbi:hypothetical protein SPHINGOAX6_30184 [Sphingomonas sp. AX6]|nr:hypothetical protein SPHINGOAX6_30184 [Sphingomonas sp. AX6]
MVLKDRRNFCFAEQLCDPRSPLSCNVANLDAAAGIYRDRVLISRIVRLCAKLNGFARLAHLELETPSWTTLVGVVSADYGEGKRGGQSYF